MKLRGKYLIRKSVIANKRPVITITGVFFADEMPDINDNDEMWVSEIEIAGKVIKFKGVAVGYVSPEEFLAGCNQRPEDWKEKITEQL